MSLTTHEKVTSLTQAPSLEASVVEMSAGRRKKSARPRISGEKVSRK
jgi:hypothetical protein